MRPTTLILILTIFYSCGGQHTKQTILSPKEKVITLPYQDLITQTVQSDTIADLNSFSEINNLWIIGATNGIYLIDKPTKKVRQFFKFEIKSHKELFDGQDKTVGFISTDIFTNKTKNKLLIVTSNGIVFQIDLKKHSIDWLTKFIHRIETATYSDNGKIIAIGTGYDYKGTPGKVEAYYSTLFLIDSQTGQFIDYFNDNASVKKILFKDSDTKLLVAYDWNNTDSYLWDINKKDKSIAKFGEEDAYLYDITLLDNDRFATVNTNGISLWDIQNPKEKKSAFPKFNAGYNKIIQDKLQKVYFLIDYSKLFSLDRQLQPKDSVSFPIKFEDADYSDSDSLIILKNLQNNNEPTTGLSDGQEGFYTFNLATKELKLYIDRQQLNDIIKTNWH